jgi:hypothetical protein
MEHRTRSILRGLALSAVGIFALPVACIYPEYTFDEPEPTSSSSSGTGGQGGGNVGGNGGGGGTPGVEDCSNGIDDDGDSQVDCADTDCTPIHECVSSPPLGWTGYVSLFDGDEAMQPECPSVFPSASPYIGHRNLLTPPHTCTACSCGDPTGQTCDLPETITVSDKNCNLIPATTNSLVTPAAWQGECFGPSGLPGGQTCLGGPCNSSVSAAKPNVVGGSCAASGGTPDIQPVAWEALGKGCSDAPQGGGCGAGKVCQPKSAAPFKTGLCVFKEGDNSCPIGPFSEKFVYFEKADDTRACSTCACGSPAGSTCDATVSVYGDAAVNNCTTELTTFQAGGCANLSGNPAIFGRKATLTAPTGGSCAVTAGGGDATGSLTAVNPTTFCCKP